MREGEHAASHPCAREDHLAVPLQERGYSQTLHGPPWDMIYIYIYGGLSGPLDRKHGPSNPKQKETRTNDWVRGSESALCLSQIKRECPTNLSTGHWSNSNDRPQQGSWDDISCKQKSMMCKYHVVPFIEHSHNNS